MKPAAVSARLGFLDIVPLADLQRFLRDHVGSSGTRLVSEAERESVYSMLFALFGFEILQERKLRRLLFDTLSVSALEQLCGRFGRPTGGKRYDMVLTLARIPWRAGTEIVSSVGEVFNIPRGFLPEKGASEQSVEKLRPFSPPPPLFDYQESAEKALIARLQGPANTGMLQLPTGAGKTRTALSAVVRWLNDAFSQPPASGTGVVWMAHTQELCEQALETFSRIWVSEGIGDISIVRFWGNHSPSIEEMEGSIVVAGYTKLANMRRNQPDAFAQLITSTGVVVVDEAHKALAPTIRETLTSILDHGETSIIGLTATPGRGVDRTRENQALADLFGGYLISPEELGEDPIGSLQARGILAVVKRRVVETHVSLEGYDYRTDPEDPSFDVPHAALKDLASNQRRNELILRVVRGEIAKGRSTLVFTCTAGQARDFALKLASEGKPAAFISHEMRRTTRSRLVDDFRHGRLPILFNFGVLTAGFDAPNIETIVIARPTSSAVLYSQMLGRGLRGHAIGGTSECTVVDVQDNVENFPEVADLYLAFDRYWA